MSSMQVDPCSAASPTPTTRRDMLMDPDLELSAHKLVNEAILATRRSPRARRGALRPPNAARSCGSATRAESLDERARRRHRVARSRPFSLHRRAPAKRVSRPAHRGHDGCPNRRGAALAWASANGGRWPDLLHSLETGAEALSPPREAHCRPTCRSALRARAERAVTVVRSRPPGRVAATPRAVSPSRVLEAQGGSR